MSGGEVLLIATVMVFAGVLIGVGISADTGEKLKEEAIERDLALYDRKTGKWRWKERDE